MIWWPTELSPATCEPCARSPIAHYWSLSQDKADLLLKRASLSCVLWEWLWSKARRERAGISESFNIYLKILLTLPCCSKLPTLALKNSDTLLLIVASVMWVSEKIVILGLIDSLLKGVCVCVCVCVWNAQINLHSHAFTPLSVPSLTPHTLFLTVMCIFIIHEDKMVVCPFQIYFQQVAV